MNDCTQAMRALFEPGVHYLEYSPVMQEDCDETIPEPMWLIEQARRLRDHGDEGMAERALRLVQAKHSWAHRAQFILDQVKAAL